MKLRLIPIWLILVTLATSGAYALLSMSLAAISDAQLDRDINATVTLAYQQLQLKGRFSQDMLSEITDNGVVGETVRNSNGKGSDHIKSMNAQLIPQLEKANKKLGADLLWVVDAEGKVLARLSEPKAYGDGVRGLPSVSKLLSGISSIHMGVVSGHMMQLIGIPIVRRESGKVAGGILAGYDLGKPWLDRMRQRFGTNFALAHRDQVRGIAGVETVRDGLQSALPDLVLSNSRQLRVSRFTFNSGSRSYFGRFAKLGGELAAERGGIVAFSPMSEKWLPLSDRRTHMLLLGALFMILIGIVTIASFSYVFSRKSAQLAASIATFNSGSGAVGHIAPRKVFSELHPFLPLINNTDGEVAAKQEPERAKPAPPVKRPPNLEALRAAEDLLRSAKAVGGPQPSTDNDPNSATGSYTLELKPETGMDDETSDYLASVTSTLAIDDLNPAEEASSKTESTEKAGDYQTLEVEAQDEPDEGVGEVTTVDLNAVFDEYLELRKQLGQPTDNVNKDKFISKLEGAGERIKSKPGVAGVAFRIFEKDGKASVKGIPVR